MGQAWVLTFFIHDVNLVNLISFIYIFFIFQTASAWGAKRSKLPGFQMREIVRWLSRKGSLDWWKRLTNWASCVIVKSPWLFSIHMEKCSNMLQMIWIRCCSSTQVYVFKNLLFSYFIIYPEIIFECPNRTYLT